MNDEPQHKHRKYWLLCIFAVFIAILGIVLPEQEDIAFEIVKNNTDLCNFNHTSLLCNGSRQNNVTYYTKDTPIILYVFAHASAAGGVAGVFVYRDDKLIAAQSGRPLASPEQTWREVTAIIPKNSSYRVNFTDFHHFEWYEDQILSGRNGTLSINQTVIGGAGCTGNCSFDILKINSLSKNNTLDSYGQYINLSAPLQHHNTVGDIFSNFDISDGVVNINTENTTSLNFSNIYKTPEILRLEVSNTYNNFFEIRQNESEYNVLGRKYLYNFSGFDLGGGNLTNCANCGGNQNLSQVLGIGNDAEKQNITNVQSISMTGKLNISITNGTYTGFNIFGTGGQTPFFTAYENNSILRTEITLGGSQVWRLRDLDTAAGAPVGYIAYGTPGGLPGIILYNSTLKRRTNMFMVSGGGSGYGLLLNSVNDTTFKTTGVLVDTQDNITVSGLKMSGSGNYSIVIADSTGKLIAVPMNGTGNHYGCFAQNGYPYPGNPGC